ncbi:MAG TPA: tRNA (adenosine(37)-N6)-dimethylallyltransferase MiaA [Xanthomonadales bacterium]|nr:tRNA (adenosine(37)-N6)-dimethylallyltransferase MiaA [Xanthomonadales bacterium]
MPEPIAGKLPASIALLSPSGPVAAVSSPIIDHRPPAIALMGPTASGKSALAMAWAERFGAGIVSVDSAQVYRGLDIGSAKPDPDEQARVPHRMLDLRAPWQPYSAAEFASDARLAMLELQAQGRMPILVGGTGLYFQALLSGLSEMPESQPELRAELTAEAERRGWPELHAELARIDPLAATRIRPGDRQRILRALEVWRLSGRPISAWQGQRPPRRFPFRVLRLALAPRRREALHRRIAARFDAMLERGLVNELIALRREPQIHAELPAIRSVGYRQGWRYLDGEIDLAGFREQAIAATRQLAKRQLTWLRGQADVRWLDPVEQADELEAAVVAFLPDRRAATGSE